VNRTQFKHWLKRLYETSDKEITCDEFQAQLPALVDFEAAGGDGREQFSAASAHLRQCPDCAADYEALREVVRLEAQSHLPTTEESLQKFEPAPETTKIKVEEGEPA
jgi:hypothetical protein